MPAMSRNREPDDSRWRPGVAWPLAAGRSVPGMTVKLVVLYTPPEDADAFDAHYEGTHMPLVAEAVGSERGDEPDRYCRGQQQPPLARAGQGCRDAVPARDPAPSRRGSCGAYQSTWQDIAQNHATKVALCAKIQKDAPEPGPTTASAMPEAMTASEVAMTTGPSSRSGSAGGPVLT